MRGMFDFIVEPFEGRYNNSKKINNEELILNTEVQNHNYVSRIGLIKAVPANNSTEIQVGDKVILHHNVFRRFRDIRGKEKNSRSYYKENLYFVAPDQIYAFKNKKKWEARKGFNFVKPIKETKMFSIDFKKPLVGVMYFLDKNIKNIKENDIVGFRPGSEYEFLIDGQLFYRVPTNAITIKYERQGNEEEYNPSWATSC